MLKETTLKKTLSLKSETLAELTADQLRGVVGAALPTLPLGQCTQKWVDSMDPSNCTCP